MAQEFAKRFYRSKEWRKLRKWYIASVFGLCERCGEPGRILHHKILLTPDNIQNAEVSLNPEHLIYVCKDCHELLHHAPFDADGRPIPENVYHQPTSPRK